MHTSIKTLPCLLPGLRHLCSRWSPLPVLWTFRPVLGCTWTSSPRLRSRSLTKFLWTSPRIFQPREVSWGWWGWLCWSPCPCGPRGRDIRGWGSSISRWLVLCWKTTRLLSACFPWPPTYDCIHIYFFMRCRYIFPCSSTCLWMLMLKKVLKRT